jgi:hypothetical protein
MHNTVLYQGGVQGYARISPQVGLGPEKKCVLT